MRISKNYLILGIICCMAMMLSSCTGFEGSVYDKDTWQRIPGVELIFVKEDGSFSVSITTDSGDYRIPLGKGRYWVTVTHKDYEDYFSVPAFHVVAGGGYQTHNFSLSRPRVTTVLLVRHAEKESPTDPDPPLSDDGEERAEKLAHFAQRTGVTAIYTTHYLRTQQTAQPLADFLKLDLIVEDNINTLVNDEILENHEGDVVLVVGHSDTVPLIMSELGADISAYYIDGNDNLFIVTHRSDEESNKVNVVNLQYGVSNGTDDIEIGSYSMTTVLLVNCYTEGGEDGILRAEKLKHVAYKAGVTAIYATQTDEAVQPLADALDLQINSYTPDNVQTLVDQILYGYDEEVVLVASPPNIMLEIIEEFGGSPLPPIYSDEYDTLFFITVYEHIAYTHEYSESGEAVEARVVSLQYGESSP